MPKPPLQKPVHVDSVKTSVRIPRALHAELQMAADHDVRSLNAEILIRLQSSTLDDIKQDIAEIKATLRKLLDQK